MGVRDWLRHNKGLADARVDWLEDEKSRRASNFDNVAPLGFTLDNVGEC